MKIPTDMNEIIEQHEILEELIAERADQIFNKYRKHFLKGDEHISEIETDCEPYILKWEVSWRYGGYDCGSIKVPSHAFCGDWETWINKLIQDDIDKKSEIEKKSQQAKIRKEKAQLKRLQEKYKE